VRVVLDTNALLRMAAAGERSLSFRRWRERRLDLILSLATLTEFVAVAARPELQRYLPQATSSAFVRLLVGRAVMVQPNLAAPTCRDPGDTALIATAVGGRAEYLVTADSDLLEDDQLRRVLLECGVTVCGMAAFETILAGTDDSARSPGQA
jgi:uncharacterized protein